MAAIEIPLLRESVAFVARLATAARRFGEPTYYFHRRVNWSHRFSHRFYDRESECFLHADGAYLAGAAALPPDLPDVYAQHLRPGEVVNVVVKVLAHCAFALVGWTAVRKLRASGLKTYRKCYVDDIELVFDPAEASVIRAVYPFPLNVRRQLRYLRSLWCRGVPFMLAGNPYLAADLFRFLWRRDVRSMMRLESRAQVRHAAQVASLGVTTVQLSDEFNLGSLDFARTLTRYPVQVINSAHGVGKYLPVHAYRCFFVLTHKQKEYYHAVRECTYRLRSLNDLSSSLHTESEAGLRPLVRLVFLSQTFPGLTRIVSDNEATIVARLNAEFVANPQIELYYKPHPTRGQAKPPAGFKTLANLGAVNGRDGTIFVSQFSTCQIDPTFKGRKLLLRGPLIHPEISFDNPEEIVALDELVRIVHNATSVDRYPNHTLPQDMTV